MRIWPLPRIEFASLAAWEEARPVALVTSHLAWEAVGDMLRLPIAWHGEPQVATQANW